MRWKEEKRRGHRLRTGGSRCLQLEADITAAPEVRGRVTLLCETSPGLHGHSLPSSPARDHLPPAPLNCQPIEEGDSATISHS